MNRNRRRKSLLIVLLALAILSITLGTGCRREASGPVQQPPVSQPGEPVAPSQPEPNLPEEPAAPFEPIPAQQGEPLKYTLRVRSLTVRDRDGAVLAQARCTVPEIVDDSGHAGITAINEQLAASQQAFLDWVEESAPEVAREDRAHRQKYFSPHVYERWWDVSYNDNGIFSVLAEDYVYTGGVHPSVFMLADSFLVESGMRLRLSEVLGLEREAAQAEVHRIALQQIEAERGTDAFGYYDDYEELLTEVYDPDDFVISPHGIIVFYQPYTIAPHAAGIPQFVIPFDERPEAAMPISPTADIDWERDLHKAAGALLGRNREVAFGIYFLGMLPMDKPGIIEFRPGVDLFFPVTDPSFPNLEVLEGFLRATYAPAQVEKLLAEERYVDIDGRLHGDLWKEGDMGYNRDWTDYRLAISEIAGDTVKLAIIISGVHPGDYEPTTETLYASLVMVNGHWVLERMVY